MLEMIGAQPTPRQPVVGLFNEEQLLLEREVASEFVAAVGDVARQPGFRVAFVRVDLDDPDLVRLVIPVLQAGKKAADRRVLREQAVPIDTAADLDGAEQLGNGGRGKQGLDRDLLFRFRMVGMKRREFSRPDLDSPHHQARRIRLERFSHLREVDMPLDDAGEVILAGGRHLVWTDFRQCKVAGAALQQDQEGIRKGVHGLPGGNFLPERFQ